MKILLITPRIYEPCQNKYIENKGGIELYLHDLIRAMKDKVDIYVLTHSFGIKDTIDNIHYVRHLKTDLLSGINPTRLSQASSCIFKSGGSMAKRVKSALFQFDYGYFEKCIKKLKPDIVHFHGCGRGMFDQIDVCQRLGIPLIVTLHGLVGLDESVNASKELCSIEQELFQRADAQGIPLTVISSGVKNRAVHEYKLRDGNNIRVILNGTNTQPPQEAFVSDLFERFGLNRERKIVVCVGSVCANKNQEAVVRAWERLPEEILERYQLVFAGKELDNGRLRTMASESKAHEHIHVLGFVPPDDVGLLYRAASLNILASLVEGFGLVIIESMTYGVPTLTYQELDAIKDIYDANVMLTIGDRSDDTLAQGIGLALARQWDASYIRTYSQRFSLENVAIEYVAAYQEIIEKRELYE